MIEIRQFTKEYLNEAAGLALENYNEERSKVSELPSIGGIPDLGYFADNGLGVAAFENGILVGFLCCYEPWEGAFDLYDSLGTFSPLHAHGAVKENRIRIYQDMYEAAAKVWTKRDIVAHGISLYTHDREAIEAFFEYGFGKRCVDQIRFLQTFGDRKNQNILFQELQLEDFPKIRPLRYELNEHLKKSPCFMQSTEEDYLGWLRRVEEGNRRTFVAIDQARIIAYLDVAKEGENFVTCMETMMNLQGAYCLPEYRGRKIVSDLLEYVSAVLREESYTLLGVDHESFNPTANRFWRKHFTPYTNSLVRRIEIWK